MKVKNTGIKVKVLFLTIASIFFLALNTLIIYFINQGNRKDFDVITRGDLQNCTEIFSSLGMLKQANLNFVKTSDKSYQAVGKSIINNGIKPSVESISNSIAKDNLPFKADSMNLFLEKIINLQDEINRATAASSSQNTSMDTSLSFSSEGNNEVQSEKYILASVYPVYDQFSDFLNGYIRYHNTQTKKAVDTISADNYNSFYFSLILLITGGGLIAVVAIISVRIFNKTIKVASAQLEELAEGGIPEVLNVEDNELGKVIESANTISNNLKEASNFALSIGEGNYDVKFSPSSERDRLSNSLLQMRDKLMKVTEEDKIRNWSITGLAKIVEIIRSNNVDFQAQMDNILSYLVKYVGANQGGLFILNNEDENLPFLELKACYAFERKKYLEKKIQIGEGLVGQAYLEKDMIYMTKVPENYVVIKSALGDGNPGSILIVPLKLNDQIEGVIELASFKPFKDHEVDFIEKIGETVASAISSVKVSERTALLLTRSQEQTEQMRAQEEEMRQNLEELQATQEQMTRKEKEMEELMERSLLQMRDLKKKIKEIEEPKK